MKFEDLKNEAERDSTLSKDKLDWESLRTPRLYNKYMKELMAARSQLERQLMSYKKVYQTRWEYYSGKADPAVYAKEPFGLRLMKDQLKIYLDADTTLQDEHYKVKHLEHKIEFLVKTCEDISRRSFHITNAIKFIKFKHGEFD